MPRGVQGKPEKVNFRALSASATFGFHNRFTKGGIKSAPPQAEGYQERLGQSFIGPKNDLQENCEYFGASKKLPHGPPLFKGCHRSTDGLFKFQRNERLGLSNLYPPDLKGPGERAERPAGPRIGQTLSGKAKENFVFRQFRFGLWGIGPKFGKNGPKLLVGQKSWHINLKELEAATSTIMSLATPEDSVLLNVDNTVILSYLKKQGGKNCT